MCAAHKKLNTCVHLKHLLARKTLLTIYDSFIRPKEYENMLYNNCTDAESETLESIQRRATRIITGVTMKQSKHSFQMPLWETSHENVTNMKLT